MKLSGIGDEDDIQFESDTSQSESEPTPTVHVNTSQQQQQQQSTQQTTNLLSQEAGKKLGNIQISAVAQPTISATAAPLLQVYGCFTETLKIMRICYTKITRLWY